MHWHLIKFRAERRIIAILLRPEASDSFVTLALGAAAPFNLLLYLAFQVADASLTRSKYLVTEARAFSLICIMHFFLNVNSEGLFTQKNPKNPRKSEKSEKSEKIRKSKKSEKNPKNPKKNPKNPKKIQKIRKKSKKSEKIRKIQKTPKNPMIFWRI